MNARISLGGSTVALFAVFFLYWTLSTTLWGIAPPEALLPATHIAMLHFRPNATAKQIKQTTNKFFALRDKCKLPWTKKPYIKIIWGGREYLNSTKDLKDRSGFTHVFVVDFHSAKDREYHVHKDPAYQSFKNSTMDILEQISFLGFSPGVFDPNKKQLPWGWPEPDEDLKTL